MFIVIENLPYFEYVISAYCVIVYYQEYAFKNIFARIILEIVHKYFSYITKMLNTILYRLS